MALTIRDVARAAGVSTATVSRALRGLENVDPRTRDRIVAIAREMKFSVSPAASRLATGKAGAVGIVTPYVGRWYFTEVFSGLEAGLAPHDVDLLLHATGLPGEVLSRPQSANERLRRRVDGVIVLGMPRDMVDSEGLNDIGVPVVLLGTTEEGYSSVSINDRLGAHMAVEHLVRQGHDRIAVISGRPQPEFFMPENDRMAGYLDVHAEHGLLVDPALREYGHFTMRGGEGAMRALLHVRPRPTAVFCMSDEMAYGAIRAMNTAGLSPGRDIAVIGFDGHELAEVFELSTVEQPVRELGWDAALLLMRQISDRTPAEVIELSTQLCVRASTSA